MYCCISDFIPDPVDSGFLVEWLIGKFNPQARDISSLRIVQWGFKVILKMTGVKVTVIGEENIPDEPVLYVGNHRSFFDILLTYSRCKRLTGYIAKKEMEKVPLLSIWMRFVYCLFLDRENPKEGLKTILKAIDISKRGFRSVSSLRVQEIREKNFLFFLLKMEHLKSQPKPVVLLYRSP